MPPESEGSAIFRNGKRSAVSKLVNNIPIYQANVRFSFVPFFKGNRSNRDEIFDAETQRCIYICTRFDERGQRMCVKVNLTVSEACAIRLDDTFEPEVRRRQSQRVLVGLCCSREESSARGSPVTEGSNWQDAPVTLVDDALRMSSPRFFVS